MNPSIKRAHNKVFRALATGKLERPAVCDACAKPCRVNAHHGDYSKPLEVVWLCDRCHMKAHERDWAAWRERKPAKLVTGTHGYSGYVNRNCRCAECKAGNATVAAAAKAKRTRELATRTDIPHGVYSTYTNWGCRCRLCKDANAAHSMSYDDRRAAA
jgi:hypothetical protein